MNPSSDLDDELKQKQIVRFLYSKIYLTEFGMSNLINKHLRLKILYTHNTQITISLNCIRKQNLSKKIGK